MISLACDHPDIEEFIEIKSDLERVTKANISIRITDKFMYAVENNEDFVLSFTREETNDTVTKVINARELFNKICKMNWDYAEPGMLFWDRIEGWNLLSNDENFHYAGTNPCAEEPLPAGGSCLLGSLNLAEFVTDDGHFAFEEFRTSVDIAVRALNEVLDEGLALHPLQEQRDSVRDWRQIGLGIFGLADMLIKMNVTYGSKESISICDRIGFAMADQAIYTSSILAQRDGVYPKYNSEAVESSEYLKANTTEGTYNRVKMFGLRNSQLLTIAPTGSLSSMIGVSGGIEPIFANYYTRKTESLHGHDEYYKVYTPIVEKYMKAHGIKDDTMLPDFFVTAQDLNYKNRIEMQSIWQNHIDASISSTVNVPNSFTVEETEDLYMSAWKSGLKGVTIFRDGCKRVAVLTTDNSKPKEETEIKAKTELPRGYIMNVSDDLVGYKRKITTGCGSIHLEVYSDDITGEPQETFINIGSGGGCERNYQFISRLISLALRAGVPIESIIDQAMSIRPCTAYVNRTKSKHDTSAGTSCPSAIGYALKDLQSKMNEMLITDSDIEEETEKAVVPDDNTKQKTDDGGARCPECGEKLAFEGGCNSCKACGWSKCDL